MTLLTHPTPGFTFNVTYCPAFRNLGNTSTVVVVLVFFIVPEVMLSRLKPTKATMNNASMEKTKIRLLSLLIYLLFPIFIGNIYFYINLIENETSPRLGFEPR